MQDALDKTTVEDDDLYADDDYEDDMLSDGLATGPAGGTMLEVPMTQGDAGVFSFAEDPEELAQRHKAEAETKAELAADHTTLTALTREIHAADNENIGFIELYDNARPHDELRGRQNIIEQMEGTEKLENVQLFNCNVVLFKKMKEDEEFRKWMVRFVKQVRCSRSRSAFRSSPRSSPRSSLRTSFRFSPLSSHSSPRSRSCSPFRPAPSPFLFPRSVPFFSPSLRPLAFATDR